MNSQDIGYAVFALSLLLVGAILYFLPFLIARTVKHDKLHAVFLLNFFLGWTLLGWIAALIWAVAAPRRPS